jgi:general stress protein YciG
VSEISRIERRAETEAVTPQGVTASKPKRRGGFNTMDPRRHAEISRMGGRKAHELGVAHRWTSDEAAEAGSKGGTASAKTRRRQRRFP